MPHLDFIISFDEDNAWAPEEQKELFDFEECAEGFKIFMQSLMCHEELPAEDLRICQLNIDAPAKSRCTSLYKSDSYVVTVESVDIICEYESISAPDMPLNKYRHKPKNAVLVEMSKVAKQRHEIKKRDFLNPRGEIARHNYTVTKHNGCVVTLNTTDVMKVDEFIKKTYNVDAIKKNHFL